MDLSFLLISIALIIQPFLAFPDGNNKIYYVTSINDESCNSHRECKYLKYTECIKSKCQCLPNYQSFYSYGCRGGINAICDSHYDCLNRNKIGCIFNTCQRYSDFFTPSNAENIKRYRATGLGVRCQIDEHCSELSNTVCKYEECYCASGYREDGEVCKPLKNATCTEDSECRPRGTKCLLNHCMFPADFFVEFNSVNASLHAAKKLGDYCQTDNHCRNLNNTECRDGTCDCVHGSVGFDSQNYGSSIKYQECRKVLNVPCDGDNVCSYLNGARCLFNNCTIPEDFFVPSNAHNVSLYAAKRVEDICRSDHHCRNINNTHCVDGLCKCKEGFVIVSSECRKLSDLFCTHDNNCTTYGFDLWCFANACQHESNYFDSADIHQYRATWINGYCRTNENCLNLPLTSCVYNRCKDPPNYLPYYFDFFGSSSAEAKEQYAADRMYGPCRTDHHCRNLRNTRCRDKTCDCLDDHDYIYNRCLRTLGLACSDDSNCPRTRTRCFLNTCLYPEDFFTPSNADKVHLYAAKRIGILDTCKSDHHCRNLNNSHCFKGACECLPGYENVNSNCQQAINVTCSDDSDCLLPRSFCLLNTCLYPEDFLAPSNGYDTSLYAAKRVGGFCQTNHHCRGIDNSRCFHRRCSCKDGYIPKVNRCDSIVTARI